MKRCFIAAALLFSFVTTSCAGKQEERAKEAVVFQKFSVDTGTEIPQVYAEYKDNFTSAVRELPVETNYFGIYQGVLYCIDTAVGYKTGENSLAGEFMQMPASRNCNCLSM